MKHILTTLIATVMVASTLPASAQAQRYLSYEPEVVELDGQLVVQSKYGPPNYGEQPKTDEKVSIPVLVLRDRVNVLRDPGDGPNAQPASDVRQIQLVFTGGEPAHKTLIGKQVVVTGTLFHAITGHHYTEVLMNVRTIERKPPGYDQRQFDVCRITTSEWYRSARYGTGNSFLVEFRAPVGEDEIERAFKHPASGLIVNVAVQYMYDTTNTTRKSGPLQIRIALSASSKEECAFYVVDNAEAGTAYKPNWGGLYVTKQVVVGDVEHSLTLSCFDRNSKRYY